MWLEALWDFLNRRIFELPSESSNRGGLFNLYQCPDPRVDLPDAGQIRRNNLWQFLYSLSTPPEILLVGEAPGWRGCRFSGVPFTDEAQLISGRQPFQGHRSGNFKEALQETTAGIFWRTLTPYFPHFIVWNALPLHPHLPNDPCSNRSPQRAELHRFLPLLGELTEILAPCAVVAIGRSAQNALAELGIACFPVRHPAHGGSPVFQKQIAAIFNAKFSNSSTRAIPQLYTV
jgi:uracil-DNA glycosylase